jgi:hypothetical protein
MGFCALVSFTGIYSVFHALRDQSQYLYYPPSMALLEEVTGIGGNSLPQG